MKSTLIAAFTLFVAAITASPAPILDESLDDMDWDDVDVRGLTNGLLGGGKGGKGRAPFRFTSTYRVVATPRQVVNGTEKTGGLKGSKGFFNFGINKNLNLICYNIRLTGFRGEYESPANTATHIHEGARGASGPPRLAFPNPSGNGRMRQSVGCLSGPFRTGVADATTGRDTGRGFHVREIERNPEAFYADVHSSLAVPGANRGQLS